MQDILAVTIPFFALVLAGYAAARRHVLPESAIPGLNAFVLYFALPCLLFRFGAGTPLMSLLNPVVLAVYLLVALVVVFFTVAVSLNARVGLKDAAFGALVGAFVAAVLWTTAQMLPMMVAAGLAIAAGAWLTGAFHEDGFADTLDALGGAVSRERALEIMKDSRLGTYGVLGLVLLIGIKWAALAALPLATALAALLLAHTASRSLTVVLLGVLRYAGDAAHAKAKPMAQRVGAGSVAVALGWSAALVIALWGSGALSSLQLLAALLALSVVGLTCARWFKRRLGGYTGDTLGAAQQIAETAVLLAVLAATR